LRSEEGNEMLKVCSRDKKFAPALSSEFGGKHYAVTFMAIGGLRFVKTLQSMLEED